MVNNIMKRRFLRLEEISEKTPYTKGDILELIEQGYLSFCAFIKEPHMAAGKIYRAKQRTIIWSTFAYEGMVKLSEEDSRALLRSDSSVNVDRVWVLEPNRIQDWGVPEQHFGRIENTDLTIIRDIPQYDTPFHAFSRLSYDMAIEGGGQAFLSQLASAMQSGEWNQLPKPTKQLKTESIPVTMAMLRIDLDELNALTSERASTESPSHESMKEPDFEVLTHPVELLVFRVLKERGNIRADKLWNLIRQDVNHHEPRKLDTDNVIAEMTPQRIEWFGVGKDDINSMSYDSFRRGLVSRVKKKLKLVET